MPLRRRHVVSETKMSISELMAAHTPKEVEEMRAGIDELRGLAITAIAGASFAALSEEALAKSDWHVDHTRVIPE